MKETNHKWGTPIDGTPQQCRCFYGTPTRVGGHLSSSQVMSMSGKNQRNWWSSMIYWWNMLITWRRWARKNHGKRGFQMRTKNTKGFDISSGSGKLESVVNKTLWFGVMNPWLVCFAKRLEWLERRLRCRPTNTSARSMASLQGFPSWSGHGRGLTPSPGTWGSGLKSDSRFFERKGCSKIWKPTLPGWRKLSSKLPSGYLT